MSGRGLGLTGGTADKLESIPGYKLKMSKDSFIDELENVGCAVISQSEKIAVADKKIYALRNEIGAVDSIPLIASSIMSKKIASGSDIIIIDLKVGKGAFMKNVKEATKLAKTMVKIVREAMDFFAGKHDKRLYELSVYISSLMISSAKNISFRRAKSIVLNLLENGYAKTKFYQWIKYQGGDLTKLKEKAKKYIVVSDKTGYVNSIDSNIIAKLVFDLGAGRKKKTDSIDYACGVILNKQLGEKVNKGEILGIIYYNKKVEDMENIFKDAFNIEKRKRQVKKIIISTVK